MLNMSLSKKLSRTVCDLFASRALPYGERRDRKVLFYCILGGLFIAIVFGLMLYVLNVDGRIR